MTIDYSKCPACGSDDNDYRTSRNPQCFNCSFVTANREWNNLNRRQNANQISEVERQILDYIDINDDIYDHLFDEAGMDGDEYFNLDSWYPVLVKGRIYSIIRRKKKPVWTFEELDSVVDVYKNGECCYRVNKEIYYAIKEAE